MKTHSIILAGIVIGCLRCGGVQIFSGLDGQTLDGICEPTLSYIQNMQNSSDLTSPIAVVQNGPEFSADFTDVFGQQWQATADFQDNYQIVFQFSSPNPSANIGSGELIQWHFYGFSFQVQDLQPVVIPPLQDRSIPSFDQNDIWMGFSGFTAYSPWNSYTYQIVPAPVPEPKAPMLVMVGIVMAAATSLRGKSLGRQGLGDLKRQLAPVTGRFISSRSSPHRGKCYPAIRLRAATVRPRMWP